MQGSIFVLCVLFLRKGVVGTLEEYLATRKARLGTDSQPGRSEGQAEAGAAP
jgi:hypothetical protein